MKILLLAEFFPETDKGEINGGVEARCFFVSKYLKDFGHQTIIISRPASQWTIVNWQSLSERFLFTVRMIVQGLQTDFEIVEGTNYTNHLVAVLLGFLKRKPIVCWYPDVFVGQWFKNIGWVGIFGEIAERLLFKISGINYIAISQATKDKLIKNGVSEEKISVVYCGVEPTKIKSPVRYDVCAVSRFLKYKHLDDLITATRDLKVVIIGRGPEEKKLRQMASKNVRFLGFMKKHEDVLKIMASAKIFCHPSTVEGFGIVIIEAAALEVPYVARDIPAVSEVTHNGQGGLLFKNDLKQCIKTLLTDRKLYVKKSFEARQLAKFYTWEKTARQTEKIYENLLSH
ncbi:glycosyltransferase family 4 protein [Candidatus Gottesmanbacteria bacterium]|nr:glycosyltransferase family 4 protein [Candidatus Gottesmanbacteria bacterium]